MDRFIRPFNKQLDTLYVSPERWAQFTFEPLKLRLYCLNQLLASDVNIVKKDIRLAMPDAVFWHKMLLKLFPPTRGNWFSGPETVFLILGGQPEHDSRYWWEIVHTEHGTLV
ncbi:hypothetical protein E4U57_001061 [Claviceps arundinis]|uniref:Uncharacterized protein n=1 Tax=Claviceps arundinis TaxID=1623583 RepID=A0ABQ7PBV6_9HYPO|nr:hypothetical protein E4U57_001061 [Claviceps arundinis]